MRVVFPHTTAHPDALHALDRYAPHAERVELNPDDDQAYWRLLCEVWAAERTTLIVEHDIELHDRVIPELLACPEPWCAFPYHGPGYGTGGNSLLFTSLGCTRWSGELMRSLPELVRTCTRPDAIGVMENSWRRLDIWILNRLTEAGHEVHTHWPPVAHHHVYQGGCACGGTHDAPVGHAVGH